QQYRTAPALQRRNFRQAKVNGSKEEIMNTSYRMAVVVAGLVLTLNGALSWGGPPYNIIDSDTEFGNTARATYALEKIPTGETATAFGYYPHKKTTPGAPTTALEAKAPKNNDTGGATPAVGPEALKNNPDSDNPAVGSQALFNNTDGFDNTA